MQKYAAPHYNFGYKARALGGAYGYGDGYGKDAAEFGHEESRYGDKTQGRYVVELPDGRVQVVEYVVDGYSGFQAKVTYEGEGNVYEARPYSARPQY